MPATLVLLHALTQDDRAWTSRPRRGRCTPVYIPVRALPDVRIGGVADPAPAVAARFCADVPRRFAASEKPVAGLREAARAMTILDDVYQAGGRR